MKKKRDRSEQCATRNFVNTDWSHLGDYLKNPGSDDESGEAGYSQELAVLVLVQEDALDWLDKKQLTDALSTL